jgi:hypothetical protein
MDDIADLVNKVNLKKMDIAKLEQDIYKLEQDILLKIACDKYADSVMAYNQLFFSIPMEQDDRGKLSNLVVDMMINFHNYKSLEGK